MPERIEAARRLRVIRSDRVKLEGLVLFRGVRRVQELSHSTYIMVAVVCCMCGKAELYRGRSN